jgi:hypothetical protein
MSIIIEKAKQDLTEELGKYQEILSAKRAKSILNKRISEAQKRVLSMPANSGDIARTSLSNLQMVAENVLNRIESERKAAYKKSERSFTKFLTDRNPEMVKELFSVIDSTTSILRNVEKMDNRFMQLKDQVSGLVTVKGRRGVPPKVTPDISKYIHAKFSGRSFQLNTQGYSAIEEHNFAKKIADEISAKYGVSIKPLTVVNYAYGWEKKDLTKKFAFYTQLQSEIKQIEREKRRVNQGMKAERLPSQEYKQDEGSEVTGIEVTGEEDAAKAKLSVGTKVNDYKFDSDFLADVESKMRLLGRYQLDNNQIRQGLAIDPTSQADFENAKKSLRSYLQRRNYSAMITPNGMIVGSSDAKDNSRR